MSVWTRLRNTLHNERLHREIDEELESHIAEAIAGFRLIDGFLWRPLPIANADRLYAVVRQGLGPSGDFRISDSNEYPLFVRERAVVRNEAELVAVSFSDRAELSYQTDDEIERVNRQYVSGWMFPAFELRPAAGRLFTEDDDR